MKPLIAVLMSLLFLVFAGPALAATPAPGEADREAQSWLNLIDAGEYGRSWETSSAFFRAAVSEAGWIAAVQAARKPFGACIQREQTGRQEATSLPGAPDGDYLILLFTTNFASKKAARETLTLMREPDRQWRVAGYFIQ